MVIFVNEIIEKQVLILRICMVSEFVYYLLPISMGVDEGKMFIETLGTLP